MAARYEEIARDLRERITSGSYAPDTAMPRMRDVAAEYGVSDITVRKAYELLTREGLLEGRGRSGVFVKAHPDQVRLVVRNRQIERDELGYYSGPEVQHWRPIPYPDGENTRVTTAPAPADVAELLGVETGELLTVRRRMVGDPSRPEYRQLADSWIAAWVMEELPTLASGTGLGGMYDRIEEWAGRALTWREEVSARMPAPEEADALLMASTGVPILRAVRITFLSERGRKEPRVVEVQDIRMSAALFAVGYPVSRSGSAKWPVASATQDYYAPPAGNGVGNS
ncbi:GntR family transcriptional regulator [Streptacidiphilus sp. N1-3]|uniref:GntR family transcriptional regulator n=1 Tax=Streptacidiphilus alkalitolerans TaxID=3342712 RepID=A0ABV6XCQ4_9ACTN